MACGRTDCGKDRLRPQWIEHWLRNPSRVQPGTRMPLIPWAKQSKHLAGTDADRIRAVKDQLMNLDRRN